MDKGREDKNVWTKWFWQDWQADTNIKVSSLAARGLWIEMLAIMAKSEKRGFLMLNGKQIESKLLAKLIGEEESIVKNLLEELKENGVYSIDESGIIYCRRMEREARLSNVRSKAGQLGGRKKKEIKSKKKAKTKANTEYASASASASEYASNNIDKILKYLNEQTGKNFRTDFHGFISARLNEGYTFEDFKKVIDIKVTKWKDDSKMNDYLRPETLFRPSKFESYLNEKEIKKGKDVKAHNKYMLSLAEEEYKNGGLSEKDYLEAKKKYGGENGKI